jgi:hypothetical protein
MLWLVGWAARHVQRVRVRLRLQRRTRVRLCLPGAPREVKVKDPDGGPDAAPQNRVLTLDGDPVKGDAAARLVLVEFTDCQCPFCARHVLDAAPHIEADYVKTGTL